MVQVQDLKTQIWKEPKRRRRKIRRPVEEPIQRRSEWSAGQRAYLGCKRAMDVTAACLLFVVLGPALLVAGLLVRLTSRGPAIYAQKRLGRDGREFVIYKLRTMVHDCESLTGPRWSTPGDPRITPVGQVLRKLHIDEFPQLWNVLNGDMSLIGPRPERPEFVAELERAVPGYLERLAVRPGITGLAQVHLPADTDLASVRKKLVHDVYYIDHVSLLLDLRILVSTVCYVLRPVCAVLRPLVAPSRDMVERRLTPSLRQAS